MHVAAPRDSERLLPVPPQPRGETPPKPKKGDPRGLGAAFGCVGAVLGILFVLVALGVAAAGTTPSSAPTRAESWGAAYLTFLQESLGFQSLPDGLQLALVIILTAIAGFAVFALLGMAIGYLRRVSSPGWIEPDADGEHPGAR